MPSSTGGSSKPSDSRPENKKSNEKRKRTGFLTLIDRCTPVIRIQAQGPGEIPDAVSEECFFRCTQTYRGRERGTEPRCRAICIRRVREHELLYRSSIKRGYNFNLEPTHPANDKCVEIVRNDFTSRVLSPEAYNTFRHYTHSYGSGTHRGLVFDLPQALPPALPPKPNSSSTLSVPVTHWHTGYYLWTSHSRRAIAHHLALDMRMPNDRSILYHHLLRRWVELHRGPGKDLTVPLDNSFLSRVVYDLHPAHIFREYASGTAILFPLPLDEPLSIKDELLDAIAPVRDAYNRLYAQAGTLVARDLAAERKIQRQWIEGRCQRMLRRMGGLWQEGKTLKHASGLFATFLKLIRGEGGRKA